jgi:hypothetical protein
MATAGDLIKGAMRLGGVLASGETPSAAEQADGLSALNDMLDSWSTENLFVHSRTREELSWTAGQASRTWGASGNFATARPLEVESAAILLNGTEQHLHICNPQEWQAIVQKTLTGSLPTHFYMEGTAPNATVYLWPVPSGTVTLVTYTLKPLTRFATAATDVDLPPGYFRALRYNLWIELAPEYGLSASAEVVKIAEESKENIKRKNVKPIYLVSDAYGLNCQGSGFDFETGE